MSGGATPNDRLNGHDVQSIDLSDDEVQLAMRMRRQGQHVYQWYERGLFRKVRLRCDDKEFTNKGLTSHESFFNVLFCAAYGYAKLDAYLVVNNDPATFCMYFFAWFSAYKNGAEYALRFNDDDLTHKIGWTLYGFCCMGMLIHTSGSIGGYNSSNFSFALFCCHVLVAIGQFRAALGIPAARFSATWKCVTLLTTACLWLVASVQLDRNRSSHNEEVLDITARVAWVLSLVIEWASYSLFFAWRGGRDMVKVSEEYRIAKYRTVCVMVLSAVLVGAANGIDPSKIADVGARQTTRWCCMLAFLTFINIKVLVVDVDVYDHADHAIARGRLHRWLWNLTTPFMVMSITGAGGCCGYLLNDINGDPFNVATASYCLSGIFAIMGLQRMLHHRPRPYFLSSAVARAFDLRGFMDAVAAMCAMLLPTVLVGASSFTFLACFAGLTLVLVSGNLAVASVIGSFSRSHRENTLQGGEFLHPSDSTTITDSLHGKPAYGSLPSFADDFKQTQVIVTGSKEDSVPRGV